MYSGQHLAEDLQHNSSLSSATSAPNSNLDRDLFNYLVQIVPLVQSLIEDLDEMDLQKMEEARKTYIPAVAVDVAVAKERRDEESITAAASARLHLQSFVFNSANVNL